FSKGAAQAEQAVCHRTTRQHTQRRARPAGSIDAANPVASHARPRTRSAPRQKKERRPAKAANHWPHWSLAVRTSLQSTTASLVPQRMMAKDKRRHRFHYRDCARKHARIMASPGGEFAVLFGTSDGFLPTRDRRRWLECHAKINVFTIADPALHASGVVRRCAYFSTPHFDGFIVLRSAHPCRCKTGADLKAFRCRYAEHRFGEVGFELIKNSFADSCCETARNALNHTAD